MISAYLDPASGSAIISAVVAGGAGAVVTAKTMMSKMRMRKRSMQDPIDDSTLDDAPLVDTSDEVVDEPTQ